MKILKRIEKLEEYNKEIYKRKVIGIYFIVLFGLIGFSLLLLKF